MESNADPLADAVAVRGRLGGGGIIVDELEDDWLPPGTNGMARGGPPDDGVDIDGNGVVVTGTDVAADVVSVIDGCVRAPASVAEDVGVSSVASSTPVPGGTDDAFLPRPFPLPLIFAYV